MLDPGIDVVAQQPYRGFYIRAQRSLPQRPVLRAKGRRVKGQRDHLIAQVLVENVSAVLHQHAHLVE
jgi:hypothetical protein